ncbi:MAG: DUF748 domain-containing protein [Motiliproteus sp.]
MINRKPLLISTAVGLCLVLLISFVPALTLKYLAKKQMLKLGAEQADVESLYLNLWTGYFKMTGLSATAEGKPELKIGLLETELSYQQLWSKQLQISQLNLADIELHLYQGDLWQVGPLTIPEPAAEPEPTEPPVEKAPTEWRAGISGFAFSKIHTSLSDPKMSQRLSIETAALQKLYQWTPKKQTILNIDGHINDSPFVISTQGTPLATQPKLELQLVLDKLELEPLSSPWIDGIKGQLSSDILLQLEQTDGGFILSQEGELSVANFGYTAASMAVSSSTIHWQGLAEQQLADAALSQASADSTLTISQLALKQPELSVQEQSIELSGKLIAAGMDKLSYDGNLKTGAATINLPGLEINNQARSWQGLVEVELSPQGLKQLITDGTLQLQQLQIEQEGLSLSEDQINITARTQTTPQSVNFDGKLDTGQANIKLDDLSITNLSRSWDGSVDLQLSDKGLQQLNTDGALQLKKLQVSVGDVDVSESQLDLIGQLQTNLKKMSFNGEFNTLPSLIQKQHLRLANQQRNWKGKLELDLKNNEVDVLTGEVKLGPLLVSHKDGDPLVSLKEFKLSQIKMPESNRFNVGQLQLNQLVMAPKKPLFSLEKITVSDISTSAEGSSINTILLGAINTELEVDKNKQPHRWLALIDRIGGREPKTAANNGADDKTLEDAKFPILAWFGELTGAKQKADDAKNPADKQATYPFTLNQFTLEKPTNIELIELSAATGKPGRAYKMTINTLALEKVDTTSEQASPFTLKAKANRLGSIDLEGDYTLFKELADANWTGKISGMSLPPFSKMMQSQTGYQIESGKLKLDANGTIRAGIVNSSNELVINNFIVVAATKSSSEAFDGKLGMPLSTAVSLLTDSHDNLNLSIPINGKLSDPDFGVQSAINVVLFKITREATMGYLSLALWPYSAAFSLGRIAMDAAEGSSINLESVYFEPGSAEITEESGDYLSKIGDLLAESEAVRLKLCGLSVAGDRLWLRDEEPPEEQSDKAIESNSDAVAQGTKAEEQPEPVEPLTGEEQDALQQLARARGEAVMIYLVEELDVKNEQLFSCLANVDPLLEAKPQVRLGL